MDGIKNWFLSAKDRTLLKIGMIMVSWAGWLVLMHIFDDWIYPAVIAWLEPIEGGTIMTIASFILCYVQVLAYDRIKKDLFGFEFLKEAKEYHGYNPFRRILAWTLKIGIVFAFLPAAILDPFLVVPLTRKQDHIGLNRRDWVIFLVAILIGNIGWTAICHSGIQIVKYLWHLFL